uniref:non-specific protein-tyrosine kinase n=1 Tax=Elaeophora elaphi TaxID=1147741 RepID=A0A0R3RY40_9BILA
MGGVYIEEALQDVLKETDLVNFERKLCVELQLSRLEHFDHSYTGLSQPAIRRLRVAIAEKKKKNKKSRGIFSSIGRKESREVTKVLVPSTGTTELLWTLPENGGTSLIIKEEIKLMERLGEGSFAVVKRAIWTPKTGRKLDVAAKILRDSTPEIIEDLQREVTNMQKLKHPNLIQLYGIVFSNPAMMVVEFCDGGALIDRLRSTEKPVTLVSMLIDYAQQIAKGMAYLESKNCVHRDLAARNVLLTNNERVAKICDFGLMRVLENNERLYVMSTQKKVPFAWCPPESLRYRQFSHASDVWSFGVTLWELFSYGEEPWIGLRGAEILTKLEAGERLPKPQRCSDELYDFISTCWSLEANLRPKFSVLKGIIPEVLSEYFFEDEVAVSSQLFAYRLVRDLIIFMVAECREAFVPSRDIDLELMVNDLVIVIHGSDLIWYGQNVRTRKFGSFYRSSVQLRNERREASTAEQTLQLQSGTDIYISKPVPGSFIHAGHGDINAEQSWGQPDYIDDIYLKNPILRKNESVSGSGPKRVGPEIIPSLDDLKPHLWVQNEPKKNGTDSYIDPFAPFSIYSFDVMNDNESCQPDNGTTKLSSSLASNFYDEPPLISHSQDVTCVSSIANSLPEPATSSLDILTNILPGTTISDKSVLFSVQPAPEAKTAVNSQQFSSLPQPGRLTSDVASQSQLHRSSFSGADISLQTSPKSLTTIQSVSASQLPSTSWERFHSSCNLQNKSGSSRFSTNVQRTFNYQTSAVEGGYSIDKCKIQNGKIPPPRPKPPNFKKIAENNVQWSATSAIANNVLNTSASDGANPNVNHSTSIHSGIFASNTSCSQDNFDPFEISKTVKDIASKRGYSEIFKDLSPSAKAVSASSLNKNHMGVKQPCSSNKLPRPSIMFLKNEQPPNDYFSSSSPGLTKSSHDIGTCYYWQPSITKASVPQQPCSSSTYGSTPTLLYDSHSKPTANGTSLLSRHANNSAVVNSSKQRNSYLSDEILGLFDPLVAERVIPDSSNVSASSMSDSDPVSVVLRNAAFADRRRCAVKLQRYNNNIEKAVNELKIEELLSMGVAHDRGQAISALQDCQWDLNAAAAALIS